MKIRHIIAIAAAAVLAASIGAFAQDQDPATPKVVKPATAPRATVAPEADGQQTQPPPAPAPPAAAKVTAPAVASANYGMPKVLATRLSKGQLINLRLEFTITDQMGTSAPVKKTVMMNVADGESGRIRTNAIGYRKRPDGGPTSFNLPLSIDAKPEVEGTKIRLAASLEYQLLNDPGVSDTGGGTTSVSQMVTSILTDGVQTILSQSADPLTDRKVTLEVKATILK